MRLKRNTTEDGSCKYSIIENEKDGHIEHGKPGTENEFFVIKMKDLHARDALIAYAGSVVAEDGGKISDYAADILDLAKRSGKLSKFCKVPD